MSRVLPRSSRAPKLLAVDLDGTLLDHTGEPHDRDLRALRAAIAHGIVVSIVTGRLYSGTRDTAAKVGILGPVGCADGSHVVRASDHATLLHHGIRGPHGETLASILGKHGPATFLFARDAIVHDGVGDEFIPYVKTWSTEVRRAERVLEDPSWTNDEGITAVVALGTSEQIQGAAAAIDRDLGSAMQVATFPMRRIADRWGLIARAKIGTKASALEWIATHHGLDLEETICVGDWLNDVSMLEVAGRSFAMGQAPDLVKESATDILEHTHEAGGGVAYIVEHVFGIRLE